MVAPNTVEIPGYAESLQREERVRDAAYTHTRDAIAGVAVRALTLRDTIMLKEIRNGFFCPFTFETREELVGHCAQLVWWMSDCPKPGFYSNSKFNIRPKLARWALIQHLGRHADEMVAGVKQVLADAFFDAPKASAGGVSGGAIAAGPAYIMDTLAEAGYGFTLDDVLDMPLAQLWQLLRLASRRLYGADAVNESDRIACEFLAKLNQPGGNN